MGCEPGTVAKRRPGAPLGSRNAAKAELETLKRALRRLGVRAIDQRTQVGRTLQSWRGDLIADLGGPENLSHQEHALVEQATRMHLIIESVDGWLFNRKGGMINHRKQTLLPIVRERVALVTALRGLLVDLGLKRRSKLILSLEEHLAMRAAEKAQSPVDADTAPAPATHSETPASPSAAPSGGIGEAVADAEPQATGAVEGDEP